MELARESRKVDKSFLRMIVKEFAIHEINCYVRRSIHKKIEILRYEEN